MDPTTLRCSYAIWAAGRPSQKSMEPGVVESDVLPYKYLFWEHCPSRLYDLGPRVVVVVTTCPKRCISGAKNCGRGYLPSVTDCDSLRPSHGEFFELGTPGPRRILQIVA